jgi:hypothetical protein
MRPVDKLIYFDRIPLKLLAEVAELADALRSGRSEHYAHEGSNPSFGTLQTKKIIKYFNDCPVYFYGVIYKYAKINSSEKAVDIYHLIPCNVHYDVGVEFPIIRIFTVIISTRSNE